MAACLFYAVLVGCTIANCTKGMTASSMLPIKLAHLLFCVGLTSSCLSCHMRLYCYNTHNMYRVMVRVRVRTMVRTAEKVLCNPWYWVRVRVRLRFRVILPPKK